MEFCFASHVGGKFIIFWCGGEGGVNFLFIKSFKLLMKLKRVLFILPNHSLIEDQAQDVPTDIKLGVGRLFDKPHKQDEKK